MADGGHPHGKQLLTPGTVVDNYKVVRLVGRGGMGEVYLARDTVLGRKVALKAVRPKALGDRKSIERFLHEARVTAQFNHPHIVAIYGVGGLAGSLYLALEFLEGQTLRHRMVDERPGLKEALRIGLAIAEALAEAHRHGILHRDLKPGNVVIPRDGRLRVVDFGLAKQVEEVGSRPKPEGVREPADSDEFVLSDLAETHPGGRGPPKGTPGYMAPEQWDKHPCTAATDIWALGVILYELIGGHHPFPDAGLYELCVEVTGPEPMPSLSASRDRPNVPAELSELVDRCLGKDPSKRPTAEAVTDTLSALLVGGRPEHLERRGPFRGLLPFSERHADLFYGRDAELNAFLERMREDPVLPIVGPSGGGKSSFVQAGVIPRLREQGRWTVIRMRPGNQPFQTLAGRLVSGDSVTGPSAILDTWAPELAAEDFEQPASEHTHRLIQRTEHRLAAELEQSPTRLALRLSQLAEVEGARVLLFVDQLEELYSLVADERVRRRFMQAMCTAADDPQEPVRVIFTVREDFLSRLAQGPEARQALSKVTVLRSPGADALREILVKPLEAMDYRYEDPELPGEMIQAVSGEPAALPLLQFAGLMLWQRRDRDNRLLTREAYEAVGGVAGALARHVDGVLKEMTEPQERAAKEIFLRLVTPEGTRRVVTRRALLEGLGEEAEGVLNRLTEARVILVRRGRRGVQVELAHEALVVKWERLAQWLEESREDLVFLSEAGQAAELWDRRGRRNEEVWHGEPLSDALKSASRCTAPIPDLVNRFLQAGVKKDRRMVRRKRALISSGIGLLVAVAVVSGIVALALADKEREARLLTDRAQKQHKRAVVQRAQAQLEGARAAADRGDHKEARAKLRSSLEAEDSLEARALWWNFGQSTRLSGHTDRVMGLSFSPDGKLLATGGYDTTVRLWDVESGTVRKVLAGHGAGVMGVTVGPNGRVLASAGRDRTVRIWDVRSGGLAKVLRGHTGRVYALAISPDGQLLASGGGERTVRVWNLASFNLQTVLEGHTDAIFGLAFSPDGRLLASGGVDGTVRVWNLQAGAQKFVFKGHRATVNGVDFSPDGKLVASSSADRTVRIWDLKKKTGRILGRHPGRVYWLAFHPDGKRVGAPGSDEAARIWEVSTGKSMVLRGHRGEVNALRFSPDGTLAATTSDDGTVRLWHLDTGRPYWRAPVLLGTSLELLTHRGWIGLDGDTPAAKSVPAKWRRALVQRARAGSQDRTGRVLCIRTYDDELEVWDPVADRRLFKKAVSGITRVLAVAGGCVTLAGGRAHLHRASGGSIKLASGAGAVSVHNDQILVALKGKVLAFDASGRNKRELGGGIGVTAMAVTGRWLVLGYREGGLELVPTAAGTARASFSFEGVPSSPVVRILFGPPGTIIAGYANGLVGMWRLSNGTRLLHTHLHGPVVHMAYRKGKLYAATELGDHAVLDLDVFRRGYCELMKKVWVAVKAVWRHGRPVAAPPPDGHECLKR